MKVYYGFNLKKEFVTLYKDRPKELFDIFNRIYYMREIDKNYGYNLFSQVSLFFNKIELNNFIKDRYKDSMMYSYTNNEHIINNLFLNEVSIMKVNNSNIRIETNLSFPAFFDDLREYSNNLFICDFEEGDYFFLKKSKVVIKA